MLIAGEASGDLLAAELVSALRGQLPDAKFFGAGGPKMAAAGVELAFDLTQHSVIGISDVLKNYFKFRRLFNQLLALAIERKPDAIIGVDYGGFNLRFGHAVKQYVRNNPFSKWNPKIIQFVSPQVWASRPGRANLLAADYDLLLSIFPFEKDWYAQRAPKLRVEFVGHPMIGRFAKDRFTSDADAKPTETAHVVTSQSQHSSVARQPDERIATAFAGDARRAEIDSEKNCRASRAKMVLPNPALKQLADKLSALRRNVEIQIGNLPQALAQADVAIASTGTVTMECAFFGVPTVTLYKTSWFTYRNRQAHRHREIG